MPGPSAWTLGVVLVIAVALIWSASTVLVQAIFSTLEFERPVLLTYVANSCFVILLPIKALRIAVSDPPATGLLDQTAALTPAEELDEATGATERGAAERASRRSARLAAARGALALCPVWFAANVTYNVSLAHTTVTTSTVLASSSAAFTLLLSIALLGEQWRAGLSRRTPLHTQAAALPLGEHVGADRSTAFKVAGVLACWAGNVLAVVDAAGPTAAATGGGGGGGGESGGLHATTGGALLCLCSALLYACYTVLLRALAPTDLLLFFGLLGAFNALALAPLVAVLHVTGAEDLSRLGVAGGGGILGCLLLKGLADNVLSDTLWAKAVLLTSPAVATVGLSLTVPIAIASELVLPRGWLVDPSPPTPLRLAGALLVVAGFVGISLAPDPPPSRTHEAEPSHCAAGNAATPLETDTAPPSPERSRT